MMLIEDEKEQTFVANHFDEWGRAGITRMWLRISDLSESHPKPDSYCEWSTYSYSQWSNSDQQGCEKDSNSCAYATTTETRNNWLTGFYTKIHEII